MKAISIVYRRELAASVRSPMGVIVAAILLLVCGLLFQVMAIGEKERLSAVVLSRFFEYVGGATLIAGVVLSIRLLAEERQQHTIVLLKTSPVRDVEVVLGKFLAAWTFLCAILLLSLYMPMLIKWHGKITAGQVAVGYLGLFLLGGATLAIGMFGSALTKNQLIAGAVGGVIVLFMVLLWPLGKIVDPPLSRVLGSLDLWYYHFSDGFMKGVLNLKDVVFYVAVIYFFLLLTTKAMEAKRWQ